MGDVKAPAATATTAPKPEIDRNALTSKL